MKNLLTTLTGLAVLITISVFLFDWIDNNSGSILPEKGTFSWEAKNKEKPKQMFDLPIDELKAERQTISKKIISLEYEMKAAQKATSQLNVQRDILKKQLAVIDQGIEQMKRAPLYPTLKEIQNGQPVQPNPIKKKQASLPKKKTQQEIQIKNLPLSKRENQDLRSPSQVSSFKELSGYQRLIKHSPDVITQKINRIFGKPIAQLHQKEDKIGISYDGSTLVSGNELSPSIRFIDAFPLVALIDSLSSSYNVDQVIIYSNQINDHKTERIKKFFNDYFKISNHRIKIAPKKSNHMKLKLLMLPEIQKNDQFASIQNEL